MKYISFFHSFQLATCYGYLRPVWRSKKLSDYVVCLPSLTGTFSVSVHWNSATLKNSAKFIIRLQHKYSTMFPKVPIRLHFYNVNFGKLIKYWRNFSLTLVEDFCCISAAVLLGRKFGYPATAIAGCLPGGTAAAWAANSHWTEWICSM